MAFFGSKSIERELRRSYSTDRLRRESDRTRTTSTPTSSAQLYKLQKSKSTMPSADEFGVVSSRTSSGKDDPPSLTFSTTTASASLTSHPLTPVTSPSLSVPVSINGSRSPSSSPASSIHKQPSSRTRTVSGSGSKHSTNSHSSNPSRRRTPQLEVEGRSSSDAVARTRRPSSGSSGSKKGDAATRTHSSSGLKVERTVSKSRSKASIRAQAINDAAVGAAESGLSENIPPRPPRSARPPDTHQTSSSKPSPPSSTKAVASLSQKHNNAPKNGDPHATTRTVSSSSSPLTSPPNTELPLKQSASSSSPSVPTMSSTTLRHEDSSLSVPANTKKSSCGNASDSSYGTPFTEFGVGGFSVKRLLSKPAASSAPAGVRSEPDTSTDSYDSYSAYALATRRRRMEGRANATETPSSVYSLTGGSLSAGSRDHSRKPTTSDPEPPRHGMGSLGRSRGIEWGHVLGRERERERGKAHAREGSSYSLSSPSEGAPGYPYGLAYERIQDRRASKNTRPVIQLTTSAVRRLSALGMRETDRSRERDRSHSPGTPMTFGAAPSPIPSPLTGASASNSRPGARNGGRASTQPSPTTASSSIVRRTESPRPPVGLTPAEIVAHQYKEQERRRAELERDATRQAEVPETIHSSMHSMDISEFDYEKSQRTVRVREREEDKERSNPLVRRASTNALSSPTSHISKSSHRSDRDRIGEPPSTPYYTVFGEPPGRVVNIGSARDSAFGLFDHVQERRAKETEQAVVAELSGCAASGISVTTTTMTNGSSDALGTLVSVEKPSRATLRRKLSRKMSGKPKGDVGSLTGDGGGTGGRESGSDGRDDKLDLGELLAGGSGLGGDDWFTSGTEGILRARPSLTLNTTTTTSGRRSTTLPRERNAASVKMSLDSYVAVQTVESASGGMLPSAVNGVPLGKGRSKDERDKEKGKLWGLVKRISSNTLKDKYKRCSSDMVPPVPALPRDVSSSSHTSPTLDDDKDKFKPDGESPRDGVDARAIHLGTPPSRSPSRRPSTAPALNIGEATKEGRFATLRKKPSIAQVQLSSSLLGTSPTTQVSRPSATTRSSSPMSSELVFSYKQSDVSSMTSYGDLTSTTSKLSRGHPVLGEHILPPETLSMFDELNLNFELRKEDDTKSKPETRAVVTESYDNLFYSEEPTCHQALPVPPRRPPSTPLVKPDADDDSHSESPTIPSFSADYAINTFGARKRAGSTLTGAEFGTNNKVSPPASSGSAASSLKGDPPPRPPRSALRAPLASSNSNASAKANANTNVLRSQSSPSPSLARAVFEDRIGRTSIGGHSQASTARPGVLRSTSSPCSTPSPPPPPELLDSSHQSPVSASDSASSTMTFRDMNYTTTSSSGAVGGGKTTLTEKEKMDKWNDLLDRSERAGGTLHVGVGGALLSDQLRESSYEPTIRDSLFDY